MLLNPRKTRRLVQERLNAATDPSLRRNPGTILAPMDAETRDDPDANYEQTGRTVIFRP